ncbi:9195_t:CDS:2 [Acaulospora morrowiae]|uniref:RING-type E3 ubiquitin transferase n=1 Tax=Acaulospora morrowiae TaxID=94023 RepID=A0A9N9EYS6_9GLOM|nr:9195_t:CDS:2 [Acaulospora morrowiae]
MSDQTRDNNAGNNRKSYFCHQCQREIEPMMAPMPTCPYCNSEFVEEINEENDPRDFEQGGGGHDTDEEYEDMNVPFTTGNSTSGPNDLVRLLQNIVTTDIDDRNDAPFFSIAQLFQRMVENTGNNNAILNLFNITGDPRDYAWGSTGLDNIISQLMEQQAGRHAPPPASEEIIENLPKKKITQKQIEEQLGCPVCKDEFKLDEEVLSLPCSHEFHGDCIKPWLKVNGTCPVCRYSLASRDDNRRNDQNPNNGTGPSGDNNNNNNGSSASSGFRFTASSSSGTSSGNQSNNNQPNRQGRGQFDMDLDNEPLD